MSRDYRNEVDRNNKKKVDLIVKDLPYFCEPFFTSLYVEGKASSTILAYAFEVRKFFDYIAGSNKVYQDKKKLKEMDVKELEKFTVDDFNEYLLSGDLGDKARARRSATIRKFYLYFYRRELIAKDPALLLTNVKIHEKEIITVNKEEIQRILKNVDTLYGVNRDGKEIRKREGIRLRNRAIMVTFMGTGMRLSELVGLDIHDVDFDDMCFHIIRKGGKEDKVFFGPEVCEAVKGYMDVRDSLKPDKASHAALFISQEHRRINIRSVEVMVKDFTRAAGLGEGITPHKFRSTFGTNLYEETGDIYLVADALGHSNVETTRKRYAKMSEDHKRTAAKYSSTLFKNEEE